MQPSQRFCAEMHPFSIAALTSPDRRSRAPAPVALPVTECLAEDQLEAEPTSNDSNRVETAATQLPNSPVQDLPAQVSAPQSPKHTADCFTPDTSVNIAVHTDRYPLPVELVISDSLMATSEDDDDKGRGSPCPAEMVVSATKREAEMGTPSGEQQQQQQQKRVEKPLHSYIALISMAILSSPNRRLVLSEIYQYIMGSFVYYGNADRPWRNSIRHNLSLNDCFIKVGRADNGKGNFWAIHPACVDDFSIGDFRQRHARRRARVAGNGDQMSAANMARRSGSYPPGTSSPMSRPTYRPYMMSATSGINIMSPYPPASYHSSAYPAPLVPTPSAMLVPSPTSGSVTSSTQGVPALTTARLVPFAYPLMAAYGACCAGARPSRLVSGVQVNSVIMGNALVSPTGHRDVGHRYAPYARLRTQLLW